MNGQNIEKAQLNLLKRIVYKMPLLGSMCFAFHLGQYNLNYITGRQNIIIESIHYFFGCQIILKVFFHFQTLEKGVCIFVYPIAPYIVIVRIFQCTF